MPGTQEPPLVVFVQILSGGTRNDECCYLDTEELILGRRREPPVNVLFAAEDQTVSNRHATLTRQGDGYLLEDESKFGTLLVAREGLGAEAPADGQPVVQIYMPSGSLVWLQLGGPEGPLCRLMVGRAFPFGEYLLVGLLGKGGMGKVYLAWQRSLGRLDVVKLIRQNMLLKAPEAEHMLQDEASISAKLDHSHAAIVYDARREPGSKVLYIAMEYLRGITLGEMASQFVRLGQRMPPDLAAALVRQACLGLHAAHTARDPMGRPMNIVHRDVSPHNILCTNKETVKVIDFGVARARDRLSQTASSDSRIVGNPGYMSPEHILRPRAVDLRSDIFSAGVVLYELITATRLFYKGENVQETWQALRACQVPPLRQRCPEATEALARAVHQALSFHPEERPASALDLARQLQEAEAEYGNRFQQGADIVRYATQRGLVLLGRLPQPLTGRPEEIPEHLESPGRDLGIDADCTTPFPPAAESQLAEGRTIAADRYRLVRRLSPDHAVNRRPFWKLYYLVERDSEPRDQAVALICGGTESPYALPEREADQFFDFAERRRGLPPQGHLPPVLDQGTCWKRGPSYLTQPLYPRTLRDLLDVALSVDEKLGLLRRLFTALLKVQSADMTYVHGDLKPENIALLQFGEDLYHVVFLDLSLRWILKLPEATNEPPLVRQCPYLAPQRRRGGPPSATDDVYALAMVGYQLLGGDPERAAQAIAAGAEPPPLSSGCQDTPAYLVRALSEALRPDPANRPSAADIVRRLQPPSTGRPALTDLTLPPPEGQVVHTAVQQLVELSHVHLRPWDDTEPLPLGLPLPALEGCVPGTIWLYPTGTGLELRLSPQARGQQRRLELYREPPGPGTHCQRYDLPSNVAEGRLYVGHHRQGVQKVLYSSTGSAEGAQPLTLVLPELGLRLSASRTQRLVALYTIDGRRETVHLVCITVGPA